MSERARNLVGEEQANTTGGDQEIALDLSDAESVFPRRYCSSVICLLNSAAVLTTLRSGAGLPPFAKFRTADHLSVAYILDTEPEAVRFALRTYFGVITNSI